MSPNFDLTYLSLGAGVQSTALGICSALGLYGVPKADVAIFADTGDEPFAVYWHLWNLAGWMDQRGIPVYVVRHASGYTLSENMLLLRRGGRPRIPVFVKNADGSRGMIRRQCTSAYKIEPIERQIRELLGLRRGQRAVGKIAVKAMLGISLDECDRMKTNATCWITNLYPLIDARLTRTDCQRIAQEHLGYVPTKSSCVYCPFHSDAEWRRLKRQAPADFAKAVEFDRRIREEEFRSHGPRGLVYVHSSLRPLAEIDFGDSQRDLFSDECSGVCGV